MSAVAVAPRQRAGKIALMPESSDEAKLHIWGIIQKAQTGDQNAIADLYRRYADVVLKFVYFRVGSQQLAEDIAQDAWCRALKRLGTYEFQNKDLGAWLVTIARNLVADHFKGGRYRYEVTIGDVRDADRTDDRDLARPEATAIRGITDAALAEVIANAMKRITAEQRECLRLRFFERLSCEETALKLGLKVGATKALQYRAVRALARHLPPDARESLVRA